jgi:uncharacterized SAM-binding protein YcdF (DUF218 family)
VATGIFRSAHLVKRRRQTQKKSVRRAVETKSGARAEKRADPPAKSPPRPRWTLVLSILVAVLVGLMFFGVFGARLVLTVSAPPSPADAILVLGGETPRRSAKAADLFNAGLAPRVFVSGGGDATIIRRYLIQEGVPADRITIEDRSTTTWENAQFIAPVLRNHNVRRVLLVTSWFHTRRAVATFRRAAGDLRFSPVAAEYSWAAYRSPWWEQTKDVCREYAKIGAYVFRHGVSPFVRARD